MNPNIKLIIFNGPPFSGKDTGADSVFQLPYFRFTATGVRARFKNVLYETTAEDYGLDLEDWVRICNDVVLKEQPMDYLNGKTPRQVLIHKSEEDIKKQYGDEGVAIITATRLKDRIKDIDHPVIVFSDGGFNCEIKPLMDILGITRDQMLIIRCHAEGCNFDNDSREWLLDFDHDVYNAMTAEYQHNIRKLVDRFLCNEHYLYHINLAPENKSQLIGAYDQTQDMIITAKSPERAWQVFKGRYFSDLTDKTFDVKTAYQITELGMVTNKSVERNKVLMHEYNAS